MQTSFLTDCLGPGLKDRSGNHSHLQSIRLIIRRPILAIDVPSGLDPTGEPSNKCIEANATITFHRMKKGLDIGKKIYWQYSY